MHSRKRWLLALLTCVQAGCADDLHLDPVVLPVAMAGEEDKADDPHPRVIVTLMASGEMRFAGEAVHLEKLSTILRGLREKRKEDLDGPSKLVVLIRADRDVEWMRVQWIVTVCMENRVYKLQLGVKLAADRSYTPEEARELDVERRDKKPPEAPRLEGKLSLPVTYWLHKRHVLSYELNIDRTQEGGAIYRFRERMTTDLKTVRAWVAETWRAARGVRGVRLVAKLDADTRTRLRHVVAAISKLREAGWKEIDYFQTAIPKLELKKPRFTPWR